jgi:hypothetical protein
MKTYKLVAIPFLLPEGEFKGHLETVTLSLPMKMRAANGVIDAAYDSRAA